MDWLVGLIVLLLVCAGGSAVSHAVRFDKRDVSIVANVDGTYTVINLRDGKELYTGSFSECDAWIQDNTKG